MQTLLKTLLFIFTFIIFTTSCSSETEKTNIGESRFDTLLIPNDSLALYFPSKNSLKDTTANSLDPFLNSWYSKMLYALREPILNMYIGDKEIYRFTWLRTFHNPVSIRLEKQQNIIRLFAKISSGKGGYQPGKIMFDTTMSISTTGWNNLKNKIAYTNFWHLKTEKTDRDGNDGSEWIIEAIKSNNYHMVTRWTPSLEREGNFRNIGEYLISLSNIKVEPDSFY